MLTLQKRYFHDIFAKKRVTVNFRLCATSKIFREINVQRNSFVKNCFHGIFAKKKDEIENFSNFHTDKQ